MAVYVRLVESRGRKSIRTSKRYGVGHIVKRGGQFKAVFTRRVSIEQLGCVEALLACLNERNG